MSEVVPRPPRLIARQLALGFGSVSFVTVVMCLMLLSKLQDVSNLVSGMRHQESSVRQSLDLATAVREQSLHIAHTLIEGNTSHLKHYGQWHERTRLRIQELGATIPLAEKNRLKVLADKTQRIHDLFIASVLPALERGDRKQAVLIHRKLERLGREASGQADALAGAVDFRMMHSHMAATNSTREGLVIGGLCAAIVILLAGGFTLRLRRVVLKPLHVLTESALLLARGDLQRRVGTVGEGEIGELAQAFDHMADEIAKRERRLVRNERMAAIGQLAAGVAHEMNNPIGIIRGYLKTMSPDEDTETLRGELAILDEEAAHCQRIAEDLLSFSRASELEIEEVEMRQFLTDSSRRFFEGLVAEQPTVEIHAEGAILQLDRARVRQVLFNLLRNATEASEPDSHVELTGSEQGDMYRIDVVDRGPGVPLADRARVFEPFFTKRKGGSGLGLAVVLGIVQSHRGTIEALQSPAGGGLFRVELPLAKSSHSTSTTRPTGKS